MLYAEYFVNFCNQIIYVRETGDTSYQRHLIEFISYL